MVRSYSLESAPGPRSFRVDYAGELNPEQLAVVMAGEGPLLVLAGAGSGKTRTITYRVSRLIESGVDPGAILLVTFTNKAAREMLERAERLIGDLARRVVGGTFHHVGHRILRSHASRLGYPERFTIMDREDSRSLLNECIDAAKVDKGPGFPKADVLGDWISFAANTGQPLAGVVEKRSWTHLGRIEEIARVAGAYGERKRTAGLVDFDDLLTLWRRLMAEHQDVRRQYQDRFRYILVDEYQDTNRLQGELIDWMAGERRNITVVGDDAQSIYAFRGAHYKNILGFPERYPDAQVFRLESNYRSTPQILALANDSISHNRSQFEKTLRPVRPAGGLPALVALAEADDQARFVAQRLRDHHEEGMPWQEMAVLYRAHHHAMELQLHLTRAEIPFTVRSGLRFFEQAHVKDIVAWLRVIANPRDETAWRRLLQLVPGVGKVTAAKLVDGIARAASPLDWVAGDEAARIIPKSKRPGWSATVATLRDLAAPGMLEDPAAMMERVVTGGYDRHLLDTYANAMDRGEDLMRLAEFARGYASTEELLGQLALQGNTGDVTPPGLEGEGCVVLTTIHQAKGLEWKAVFLLWLAQGRFPDQRAFDDDKALDEERRLFYVAVTRAQDHLYLCHPLLGREGGYMGMMLQPSEFIQELDPSRYERWDVR